MPQFSPYVAPFPISNYNNIYSQSTSLYSVPIPPPPLPQPIHDTSLSSTNNAVSCQNQNILNPNAAEFILASSFMNKYLDDTSCNPPKKNKVKVLNNKGVTKKGIERLKE